MNASTQIGLSAEELLAVYFTSRVPLLKNVERIRAVPDMMRLPRGLVR